VAIEDVHRILVVGSGAMGSQIGAVRAPAGYETTVQDISPEARGGVPSRTVTERYQRGDLGRKTGRGFYDDRES
jgi:3-hydroxyacyl-CoA dehydrogenase